MSFASSHPACIDISVRTLTIDVMPGDDVARPKSSSGQERHQQHQQRGRSQQQHQQQLVFDDWSGYDEWSGLMNRVALMKN